MSGGCGIYGGQGLGYLVDAQRAYSGYVGMGWGGFPDLRAYQNALPAMTPEQLFKYEMERFARDENLAAKRRTRIIGWVLSVPFTWLLIEAALAYFLP